MTEYHKINSVYKRDQRGRFMVGDFSCPEFEALRGIEWEWTEKVDGTNVRISYYGCGDPARLFGGRTDASQMPTRLIQCLERLFPAERLATVFPEPSMKPGVPVVLYGEGFGNTIQKVGPRYRSEPAFILFDVRIDGLWLRRADVADIAGKLDIPFAPVIGRGTLADAERFVRMAPASSVANDATLSIEGLVLRPAVELLDRRGNRIITKLKVADFA